MNEGLVFRWRQWRSVAPLLLSTTLLAGVGDGLRRPWILSLVFSALFASFAWALWSVRGQRLGMVWILLLAALLRVLALAAPPTLSGDVDRYIWDGRLLNAGLDPYSTPPDAAATAPFRDARWHSLQHRDIATVYPPLALGFFSIAARLPRPVLAWRVFMALCDLLVCALLVVIARRLRLPLRRATLYAWNPLPVFESATMGHVDALGVAAVVVGAALLLHPRSRRSVVGATAAAAALAAGVLAKLAPAGLAPLWAERSGRRVVFGTWLGALALLAVLPWAVRGAGVPQGLLAYSVRWEFNGPLYEPLWRWLELIRMNDAIHRVLDVSKLLTGSPDFWNALYPWVYAKLLAKILLGTALLAVFWCERRQSLVRGTYAVLGAVVLCSATVYPWYLLWVLPWAALLGSPAWIYLSAVVWLTYLPQLSSLPLHPLLFWLVWGPFWYLLGRRRWSFD